MNSKKIFTYVYYSVIIILILIYAVRTFGIPNDADELQKGPSSFGLWQAYIYIGIATVLGLVLSVVGLAQKPKVLLWSLAGVGVLVVLLFIGKSLSSDIVPQKMIDDGVTLNAFQFSHAGVWLSGILIGFTILLAVASSVKTIFDK